LLQPVAAIMANTAASTTSTRALLVIGYHSPLPYCPNRIAVLA
jgi:hypothetical protein